VDYRPLSGSSLLLDGIGDRFMVGDTTFRYLTSESTARTTTDDEVLILKHAPFLALYDRVFSAPPTRNVLEFGVAEGGSIIYFALAFPALNFVGIDLRPENPAVLRHLDRLGISDRVRLYYGTDQTDEDRINRIIEDNFGDEPLGAVVDDASHMYRLSRRTFEIAFGRIAAGGTYCLEDWGWSHEPGHEAWADEPALSNLVFELTALMRSTRNVVAMIETHPVVSFVTRGPARVERLELDRLLQLRGRRLPLI
jgi:hypothetical protein